MSSISSKVQGFDLPDTWRRKRIKYVATYNDEALSDDTDDFKDIQYIEISSVSLVGGVENVSPLQFHKAPSRARRIVRGGDTLVSTVRTYLKAIATVRDAPDNLIASTGFCVIRPSEEIDAAFLGWVMKSEPIVGEIVARSVGVSYPATNASDVVKLEVPLPNLDTQRRIAGYLDDKTARIDALIEKKRTLLGRLAEKHQALITRAVTRGLNPDAPLKDRGIDWLGNVPTHWEVWPLKRYLTESQYGISEALSEAGDVAILRMGNIQNLAIDLTELKFVEEVAPFLLLQQNDVLFNRTNSIDLVGKSAIYKGTYDGALSFASYLARFRFDARYLPEFANFVFGTEQLLEYARTMAFRAIGQANLNPTRFAEIAVPVPPIEEQRAIIDYLTPHGEQTDVAISQIKVSIEKLTEYRAALITAAVTGKVKSSVVNDNLKPAKKEAPAAFKRSVLATYIADTLCDHSTFGRVKFQKLLHLSEGYANANEVAGDYQRDAAGPFDTRMMRSVHSQIKKQGWIVTAKREGDVGTHYIRGDKIEGYKTYFDRYFSDRKDYIDYLLALFRTATTQQVEIVSTTFAAWNDLLLEGKTPTDDEIVELILNDWHDSKRKITQEQWYNALPWMREKGLIPRGLGEHTKKRTV